MTYFDRTNLTFSRLPWSDYFNRVLCAGCNLRHFVSETKKSAVVRLSQFYPAISVLKPLHGESPGLERNIESFFGQDYAGPYELLFCARHESDEGLQLARRIAAKYQRSMRVLSPVANRRFRTRRSTRSARLLRGPNTTCFITSDADVRVKPNYLSHCIQELLAPEIDLAFWPLSRHYGHKKITSSRIGLRLVRASRMSSGVLVADMLSGTDFALGPTMIPSSKIIR